MVGRYNDVGDEGHRFHLSELIKIGEKNAETIREHTLEFESIKSQLIDARADIAEFRKSLRILEDFKLVWTSNIKLIFAIITATIACVTGAIEIFFKLVIK